MSWLYSIVLAGLAFSATGSPVNLNVVQSADNSAAYKADETEHFDQTYPITPDGKVKLSNVNGSVTVEAWDRNEVRVEYTKTADSKERLGDVNVKIDSRPDAISIETDYDNWKKDSDHAWKFSGKLEVAFKLTVPRGAMLNEIETVNGSIDLADFTNYTKVSAVNGTVNARNIRGTARLSTVNGEVHADFDRLETGSRITLDTVNGHVNLVIPSDANATVKADSLNGNITNDFGLPVRKGKYVGRDLYGKLGSGEVQIKLSSVNGQLAIGRKNDGRQLSPATDLLPAKGKGDDDWDSDLDVVVHPKVMKIDKEKINKQIRESVQKSQIDVSNAMTQAAAEITKIGPEIAKAVADSAAAGSVKIDEAAIQKSIQDAVRQQAAIVRSIDAVFLPGVPRIETKSNTIPVKGVPTVTVYAEPASVKITGWDRSEVQYRVTQRLQPRRMDPLKVTEESTESTVNIGIDEASPDHGMRYFGDGALVTVEVMVPRKCNLKITANGETRVEGVSGEIVIHGTEGAINIRDSDGKLEIATFDGRVRVIGFRGDAVVDSSEALVNLEGDFASLTAKAGVGSVSLTLPANASADLESNCDSVVGDGIPVTKIGSKDERNTYRIGAGGGRRFLIESDGRITIRSAETLAQVE